jgi:DNA-binding CsgD family transcriptional regulator
MAARVSSARIIGRTSELAELEAALSDAAAGRPSLAFVAGESGVGKTRLLDELVHRGRERHGASVLAGDCVELGEGELPYAPLVSALRPLVRRGDAVFDAIDPSDRAELAALAPSLAVAESRSAAARAPRQDADARGRLFEALLSLLEALGRSGPVLLLIEDLHWADGSTRAFLSDLAASLCREPVVVVCSYRPDELHRRHPLRPVLAELERDQRARRVELLPLSRDELAEQLEGILGAPADAALVDRLWRRTEGNPLFTEELLAAGLDGRGALPPTLRDALILRIERLEPDAQELLRVVAAAQRADHDLLADAAGLDSRALRDALREVVAANLLVVDDDGRYAFRHALLREVVVDDLLPGEAAELHRALARALEPRMRDGGGAQVASAIAHHHLAAGDREAALVTSVRAGKIALEVPAAAEAAALLDRALELWDRVPDAAALAGVDHVALLGLAAHARDLDGDLARQEQLLRRALELADADADPERVGRLLGRLHRAQFALNRQDEAMGTLDRGLALLPSDRPSVARAALLTSKAKTAMLRSRFQESIEAGHEALAAAQAAGARRSEGRVRNALGTSLMGIGELDAGAAQLREAWAIAEELGDLRDVGSAATNLSDQLHLHGRTAEALAIAREGLEAVRMLPANAEWLSMSLSEYLFDAGDWEQAAALVPPRLRRNAVTTVLCRHLRLAELALGRDDRELARTELDAVSRHLAGSVEPQFLGTAGALLGELRRRDGDLPGARSAVEDALEAIEFCSEDAARIARAATVGVRIEADAAQHARDRGDDQGARDAIVRAELLLSRVEAAATGPSRPIEAAYLLTAQAEMTRAAGADDPDAWTAAAAAWDAMDRPYLAAQVRWREAEARFATGDRDGAAAAAASARQAAVTLGSAWLRAEVESFAARARLRVGDEDADDAAGAGAAAEAAAEEDPFGLTPRERQVLALVARGATNREVGETLFMAEKTASVHVSRILAKLGVRSRTEAAGVAHRLGLDESPV